MNVLSRPGSSARSFSYAVFDYTAHLAEVCSDICFRVPSLNHIDMRRVAVSFSQTKHCESFGTFACVVPMRFENGEMFRERCGKKWTIQHCYNKDGTEYLYLMYFFVPRFIELTLTQKLQTIVHELYHINPEFNGDIRRFNGRCFAHGSSQKKYDKTVQQFTDYWLKQEPPEEIWNFLRFNYKELTENFGRLVGTRIKKPMLIPAKDNGA
ncbi:hypothetical protein FACS18942_09260 [Planctomycetales bacterium]|nr:hypothetical protein FACS18942_09260 [Planctomycetales bacterium]